MVRPPVGAVADPTKYHGFEDKNGQTKNVERLWIPVCTGMTNEEPGGRLLLTNIQLYLDGLLNLAHIFLIENSCALKKPCFADGRQLIRHGLALFTFKEHQRLTGIEAVGPTVGAVADPTKYHSSEDMGEKTKGLDTKRQT